MDWHCVDFRHSYNMVYHYAGFVNDGPHNDGDARSGSGEWRVKMEVE